jgi:arsenate reductase
MAEALLRHYAGDRFEAVSAGTHPVGLNPDAAAIMQEIGIDISTQRSKSVDEFLSDRFDYVITVCDSARESCPVFPAHAATLHWSLEDPAAAIGAREIRMAVFRRIRDEIACRIRELTSLLA